ncbi:MAG: hemerythrin domain-containing protein [Rhodoferax sp.]
MPYASLRYCAMTHQTALPGFSSPAVGFDQPHEMLKACHERVQRSLDLLQRLVQHLLDHGHDPASRSAAQDVLRYFDQAAPLHHEDEELHLFPVLLAHGDADVQAAVRRLQDDHLHMHTQWQQVRQHLLAWAQADAPAPSAQQQHDIARFCTLYPAHIALEEETVYPAAFAQLGADAAAAAGSDMRRRRQGPART